jgi:hypothetical protein
LTKLLRFRHRQETKQSSGNGRDQAAARDPA